ncbi:hypothetical protein NSA19_03750 [Actinomyces bowdenii]|nr:hypothetical protein [Actinomyces bowdenii]
MRHWLRITPIQWRLTVEVSGPVHRTPDGYLGDQEPPWTVKGCMIAPGAFTAPGMTSPQTSEATDDVATLYAPPGARIRHRDTVTIPQPHPLAGTWAVEADPEPWPLGLAVPLTRR